MCFRTSHAIAKHQRPYTDYVWHCSLDAQKGLEVGNTYCNDKSAKMFIHSIAEVERRHLSQALENAHFISLISDGTTDVAVIEAEILYIRYAVSGVITTTFVGIDNVEKADAASIKRAIDGIIERYLQIPRRVLIQKLVGFGSDGAAVMMGAENGVTALFRKEQPCMQAVHCYAHRLELAYKDAMGGMPVYAKLNGLLLGLYSFYKKSPLNRSNLKAAYTTVDLQPVMPSRVGGTRWLPHLQKALQTVVSGYPAFMVHLSQMQVNPCAGDSKAKAAGFLLSLRRRDTVEMIHFMLDVLYMLSKLSLTAQTATATVADVHTTLVSVVDTLERYKTHPAAKERALSTAIRDGGEFHGENLSGPGFSEQTRLQILTSMISRLHGRFSDCDSDVVKAASIVSFKQWPQEAGDFGDDEVATLTRHFSHLLQGAGFDTEVIEPEWALLKAMLYRTHKNVRNISWSAVNESYGDEFRNILGLVDAVLTLPASSADAERGFSQLKLTKSNLRSKLRSDRLSDLMTIQLQSPPIVAFDPQEAIELWSAGAQRRPNTQPLGQRVAADAESSSSSSSSGTDSDTPTG